MVGLVPLKRMDNVLLVVDDLEAVKAFFVELGLQIEGETTVEGPEVGALIGLDDVRATLVAIGEAGVTEVEVVDTWVGRDARAPVGATRRITRADQVERRLRRSARLRHRVSDDAPGRARAARTHERRSEERELVLGRRVARVGRPGQHQAHERQPERPRDA